MKETLGGQAEAVNRSVRGHLAALGGHALWRVVGVAVGAIGYAAEAGFELEMRRVASRSVIKGCRMSCKGAPRVLGQSHQGSGSGS